MTNRAIALYPKFINTEKIQEIRKDNDPLYTFIAPHLTLVFPFESDLSQGDLSQHISQQLMGVGSFTLTASDIVDGGEGYVFLDIKEGNENVIALHDLLYEGVLETHLNKSIPFKPHITVARIGDSTQHEQLMTRLVDFDICFDTVIDSVHLVNIDGPKEAITEWVYKLKS